MTQTNGKRKKMYRGPGARIIEEWNQKSINDFAIELEISPNKIRKMVHKIRQVDPSKCPEKPKTKREDIVRAALEMLSAEDDVVKDK